MTDQWDAFLARTDPEYREPLAALAAAMPPDFRTLPAPERRALAEAHIEHVPERADVTWSDRLVPGEPGQPSVPVRLYRPRGATGALPVVVHIHGGGMWAGSIEGDHAFASRLCGEMQTLVVSVDYRLAPEHPYPAAVQDCIAALHWVHHGELRHEADRTRICVHGPSAGGGLAIALALAARERSLPVGYLMAIYPMIDDRDRTASTQAFHGLGPAVWDREANTEAWRWYLDGAPADELAAPSRSTDLTGLPPTFIDVGTLDLFRDEDIAFAGALLEAGVPTELHVHPGAFHGSEAVAPDTEISRRILRIRAEALRTFLHPRDRPDPPEEP